jgi:hypothetical protein
MSNVAAQPARQAPHQAQDLPAQPRGQSLDEPLIVSIDLSEIAFT